MIQGITCDPTGLVNFHANGELERCRLLRDSTWSGQPLPARTMVRLDSSGCLDWCFLARDTELDGVRCLGRGSNYMTSFYPDGRLKISWLARDQVVQGVAFRKGDRVDFTAEGNVVKPK